MTDQRMNPDLITEILDVLDRHGYARGDNEHTARALLLISDLAHIYEGVLDHPFGPYINETPPPRTEPAPPELAAKDAFVLSASQVKTLIAALDEASLYKRDRVATCADCTDQSCGTCQWRLEAAETYESLAAHLIETKEASGTAAASRPGPVSQPQPAADREAGQ